MTIMQRAVVSVLICMQLVQSAAYAAGVVGEGKNSARADHSVELRPAEQDWNTLFARSESRYNLENERGAYHGGALVVDRGRRIHSVTWLRIGKAARPTVKYGGYLYVDARALADIEGYERLQMLFQSPIALGDVSIISLVDDSATIDELKHVRKAAKASYQFDGLEGLRNAIRRAKGNYVFVLGHNEGGTLISRNRDGTELKISVNELSDLAQRCCGKSIFPLTCGSAAFAKSGVAANFNSVGAVQSFARAAESPTAGEFFSRLARPDMPLIISPASFSAPFEIAILQATSREHTHMYAIVALVNYYNRRKDEAAFMRVFLRKRGFLPTTSSDALLEFQMRYQKASDIHDPNATDPIGAALGASMLFVIFGGFILSFFLRGRARS